MNIGLIGYRGAGKSTVGRRLASRLQRKFVDTDNLIEEHQGARISEIVKSHGWGYFRAIEKRIIEEVSKEDHLIIATGGGAVLDNGNLRSLKKNGLIIWLKADQQVLLRRMDQDPRTNANRPTLTGKGILDELGEMVEIRSPFYEKASDVQLDTSTLDIEAVVERVLSIIEERMGT